MASTKLNAPTATPVRGREAATERIFLAAEKLFAQMPPSEVTTRAIAEHAQVNLALIHRYVGPKEEVLRQVMQRYAHRFKADVEQAGELANGLINPLRDPAHEPFLRTLAFLTLTGYPIDDVLAADGGLKALLKMGQGDGMESSRVVAAMAMGMGWTLFHEFLLKASGLQKQAVELDETVHEYMRQMTRKTLPK